jgi:hypothetical protein
MNIQIGRGNILSFRPEKKKGAKWRQGRFLPLLLFSLR